MLADEAPVLSLVPLAGLVCNGAVLFFLFQKKSRKSIPIIIESSAIALILLAYEFVFTSHKWEIFGNDSFNAKPTFGLYATAFGFISAIIGCLFLSRVAKDFFWKLGYSFAAGAVFMIDQITKAWAVRGLRFGDGKEIIPGFLSLAYTQNTGVAFSMFDGHGDTGRWILSAVAYIAARLVLYFLWKNPGSSDRILGALCLLLAGIVGNMFDRVRLGFVVDFIDVKFGSWHYPTFNVADAAICIGAGLLVLDIFFSKRRQAATNPQSEIHNPKLNDVS